MLWWTLWRSEKALRHSDARPQAVATFVNIGAEAVPRLILILRDADPQVRGAAASALERIGGSDAFEALARLLGDSDDSVRMEAVAALNRLGRADHAVQRLVTELRHLKYSQSVDRRKDIARALLHCGSSAVDPLIALLRDRDSAGHAEAAYVLGALKDERAIDALGETILHRHPGSDQGSNYSADSQLMAVAAVLTIGATKAVPYLQEALTFNYDWDPASKSYSQRFQQAVQDALIKLDPSQRQVVSRSQELHLSRVRQAQLEAASIRKAADDWAAAMSETSMVESLRDICRRWSANEVSDELRLRAQAIGQELNRRGGIGAMKNCHAQLRDVRGARTLDQNWDGIGEWRG